MSIWSRLSMSDALSRNMARKLDIPVPDGFGSDDETRARTLRAMTLRCATCTEQSACIKLQNASETLDTAPEYCRNKALFGQLKGV